MDIKDKLETLTSFERTINSKTWILEVPGMAELLSGIYNLKKTMLAILDSCSGSHTGIYMEAANSPPVPVSEILASSPLSACQLQLLSQLYLALVSNSLQTASLWSVKQS